MEDGAQDEGEGEEKSLMGTRLNACVMKKIIHTTNPYDTGLPNKQTCTYAPELKMKVKNIS